MRLFTVFLFAASLAVSARPAAQTVTVSGKNLSLKQVFSTIKKQTGYLVLGTEDIFNSPKTFSLSVTNLPLSDFLKLILKDLPLEYEIADKTIFISPKSHTASIAQPGAPDRAVALSDLPPPPITGRIRNSEGEPLAGASVRIKGSAKGVSTDANGRFAIDAGPGQVLVVSYTGYQEREIPVTPAVVASSDQQLFTITLELAENAMEDVIVKAGYYDVKKKETTGNISRVTAAEIGKQPVVDPILALAGRVPGLVIKQSNGFAGSGVAVQIQGQNSISYGNAPLYVVDGVPYASDQPQFINSVQRGLNTTNTPQPAPSPFAFINPNDIESISILKDADATSIYGSRAANGVILITTKKGKSGKTAVSFNIQHGLGTVANKMDLMNTDQYLEMRNQAMLNTGLPPAVVAVALLPTQYDINGLWDKTRYTDWQKELIGGSSKYTDVQGSVSGGSANTQFLISAGYHRETTVFPSDHSDQKGSLHLSLNHASDNQKFKLQLTASYQLDNNNLPAVDLTQSGIQLAPNAPAIYNSDGTLNWAPTSTGTSSWNNPLAQLLNSTNLIKTNNLVSNSIISYQLFKGFVLKTSFGYTNQQQDQTITNPSTAFAPESRRPNPATSAFVNNDINSWIIEPQVNYNRMIGSGKMEAIVGGTHTQNNSNSQSINASVFASDQLLGSIGSAGTVTGSTSASVYKYQALFGRVNYNWDSRYIVNLTARRDGSSRFGSENQFHNFWSAAGAWIFSNGQFMREKVPVISFGKLSVSYGTTGNDQIPNYTYLATYNSNTGSPLPVANPYLGVTGLLPTGLSNPYVQWEMTTKFRIGLDLGFLKDRIFLVTNYFQNRSSNQLLPRPLPVFVGFPSITENFPAIVQNTGWEFTVNTSNIVSKAFKWTSSVNLTIPKNELLSFPDIEANPTYANRLIVGQPVNIVKTFINRGVNATTGSYQYLDAHGQLTTSPVNPTDRNGVQNINPEFYGGFQNSLSYKSLQLDFLFQFVKQMGNNNYTKFGFIPGLFSGNIGNQPVSLIPYWQQPGDNSQVQGVGLKYANPFQTAFYSSDAGYTDASFVRLKNVSLSWQMPVAWTKKVILQNARIYIQGQNLLTFTHLKGPDPETQNASALPPLRVITVGLNIEL